MWTRVTLALPSHLIKWKGNKTCFEIKRKITKENGNPYNEVLLKYHKNLAVLKGNRSIQMMKIHWLSQDRVPHHRWLILHWSDQLSLVQKARKTTQQHSHSLLSDGGQQSKFGVLFLFPYLVVIRWHFD